MGVLAGSHVMSDVVAEVVLVPELSICSATHTPTHTVAGVVAAVGVVAALTVAAARYALHCVPS